ncbi:MAG: DNA repair protein RecO C-terminal domain-containing protein [Paludibacteraceae bacterium]|nr:DNA repair protein RecO C-terminal domain-containing protein [Paludibacteraceae bacterium]
MLTTTEAIVLALQPHSDKAHILHAYTRAGGRVNYMVYGLGRKHSAGIYTPLAVLQLTADQPHNRPPSVRTAHLQFVPATITSDPYKQTIALFLSEVLYHTLRHPMEDAELYDFLRGAIRLLDDEKEPQNFHLQFLIGLAERLGFAIDEQVHPELVRVPASRADRQKQLRQLCSYLSENIDSWQSPRSLDVLTEIFD